MLKNLTNKFIVAFALLAVLAFPSTFMAADVGIPAFTHLTVNETSINQGQTVTFSISTVNAAYVFAESAGVRIPATMQTGDNATRRAVWTLTVQPSATQSVSIFASLDQETVNAASIVIPITVNALGAVTPVTPTAPVPTQPVQPVQPQPPAQTGNVIFDVSETQATAAGMVTLTIITNNEPGTVWINVSERFVQATRISQNATESVWEVSYRPLNFAPHQILVYANQEYVLDGSEVSQTVSVQLTAPYVPAVSPADISRSSLNATSIDLGAQVTLTVRTNADVNHVWATVDRARVNLTRGSTTAGNNPQTTWTATFRPNETQEIPIFANIENNETNAATDRVRITVRDRGFSDAPGDWIQRADLTGNNFLQVGEVTEITVRTTPNVSRVWAMVDGRRLDGRRMAGSQSDSTWVISNVVPQRTQTIEVFATPNTDERNAARRNVNVTVIGTTPEL
ncbi:MAG: hypothetical protein FWG64_05260 [Firmicutes bacterium]|nr:hypothetical protein [Bacillota bacterium]